MLDTIRGELLDVILPWETGPADPESGEALIRSIFDIYRLKTARYSVVGPLHLGMLLAGADRRAMEEVDSFAEDLGVAFQIKDDLLGIYADEQTMGKDAGSDIAEGKLTLLYAHVRKEGGARLSELERYYGRPQASAEAVEAVQRIFSESGAKAYAEREMEKCFAKAQRKLRNMEFLAEEDRAILQGFIEYSRNRGH